ncbi:hypothetical protein [Anthocerotibacter panamensis]|nr:hypothetical protein [Anthocerotibacter panamensis]
MDHPTANTGGGNQPPARVNKFSAPIFTGGLNSPLATASGTANE